jgi:DNA repair protein RadC
LEGDQGKLSIKSWSEEDRPREKLLIKGPKSLSDAELITIFIRTGTRDQNALEIARVILNNAGNDLNALADLSILQLTKIRGVGKAKAITIAAALELGRRRKESSASGKKKLTTSRDAYDYLYPLLADQKQEIFYLILLARNHQPIRYREISRGGVSATVIDPKVVFNYALEELASSIIICHNHPSGNTQPSQQDIDLTRKIRDGARLLEIDLLDHIIFTNSSFYSFADEGLI